MIEVKRASKQLHPRSGLNQSESVRRASADWAVARPSGRASALASTSERPPSRSGYRPSAARTISTLASLIALIFALANSNVFAQQPAPVPTASPMVSAQQSLKVPSVAIDYRADANQPLPPLSRVGVDTNDQQPMTLREAIALALANNKDIEVARDNVKIAEYDLLSTRGAYDPRISAQSYYERIKTPAASFLSGASNARRGNGLYRHQPPGRLDAKVRRQLSAGLFIGPVDQQQSVHRAQSAVSNRADFQLYPASGSRAAL